MGSFITVQKIYHGITDGGAEEAPHGMCDGIPVGIAHIVATQFAQNLTGKNVEQNYDLQPGRKSDTKSLGQNGRQQEEEQHQQTDEYVFPQADHGGANQNQYHQQPQHHPGHESSPIVFPLL